MQTSPLDGLHDIIAPTQVDWWPLAPAWWVVIAIAVCLLCSLIVIIYKNYRFKKPKRDAIALATTVSAAITCHFKAFSDHLLRSAFGRAINNALVQHIKPTFSYWLYRRRNFKPI